MSERGPWPQRERTEDRFKGIKRDRNELQGEENGHELGS